MSDVREFRAALGAFATGVTVITTLDAEARPVGVTANSFNSVSLDPPMVLWSLAKTSLSKQAFCTSGHFAIHVLSSKQQHLSNNFARSGAEKFASIPWCQGQLRSPILDEYAALFECRTVHQYEGGDHIILVGEVVAFDSKKENPLLFHAGQYAEARPKPTTASKRGIAIHEGRFTDEFLLYLVSRAHFQSSRPVRAKLAALGLSQDDYMALALLSMNAPATAREIAKRLEHTGFIVEEKQLDAMVGCGLLMKTAGQFDLAKTGRNYLVAVLAVAKAFEDDLLDHFTSGEIADVKNFLKKLIDLTGRDVPPLWRDADRQEKTETGD